jgi:hypothetical protein
MGEGREKHVHAYTHILVARRLGSELPLCVSPITSAPDEWGKYSLWNNGNLVHTDTIALEYVTAAIIIINILATLY